jgi:acetyl-CoA C-acetyltransferase
VVVAGGTESLSSMPQTLKSVPASARDYTPWMSESHPATPDAPPWDMAVTVGENTAREAGITRRDADEWAMWSHQRAGASVDNGWFDAEVVPVPVPQADGSVRLFERDEHPRRDTTMERLGSLPTLHPELDASIITAGNAAGLNDAAAAVMVVSSDYAKAHGLPVLGTIRSWASVGVEPARTGMGPVYAIPKALDRAGRCVADIALFEVNEAFTPVPIAAQRAVGIATEILNVNGSGCGLGHPIAATGARMVVTMVHELARRGGGLGCVSMCAGGGMGSALVLEV